MSTKKCIKCSSEFAVDAQTSLYRDYCTTCYQLVRQSVKCELCAQVFTRLCNQAWRTKCIGCYRSSKFNFLDEK